jgi:hypothetical protein
MSFSLFVRLSVVSSTISLAKLVIGHNSKLPLCSDCVWLVRAQ